MTPNIFHYTDYVRFLADAYDNHKAINKHFSFEGLARKLGLKSKGAVHNIIQGKRGISNAVVARFCRTLSLSSDESNYFRLLVSFKQTKELEESNGLFEQITTVQKKNIRNWAPQILTRDQFEFYARPYHCVVRSLIGLHGFTDDYNWLARALYPRISPKQARKSVALLEKMGLIQKEKNGNYILKEKTLTTEKGIQNLALQNFHLEMGRLALESISNLSSDERNVQGATLGISQKTYGRICDEMTKFRLKLLELAEQDDAADRVCRINLQFFPVSDPKPKRGKQ